MDRNDPNYDSDENQDPQLPADVVMDYHQERVKTEVTAYKQEVSRWVCMHERENVGGGPSFIPL